MRQVLKMIYHGKSRNASAVQTIRGESLQAGDDPQQRNQATFNPTRDRQRQKKSRNQVLTPGQRRTGQVENRTGPSRKNQSTNQCWKVRQEAGTIWRRMNAKPRLKQQLAGARSSEPQADCHHDSCHQIEMVCDGSDSLLPFTVWALHIILLLPFFLFILVMLSLLHILVSHQLLSLVAFSGFLSVMFLGPLPPSLPVFQPDLCLLSSHLLSLFIHHISYSHSNAVSSCIHRSWTLEIHAGG